MTVTPSPVRFEGHLDEPLRRWSWLYKWFLAIPHILVLACLWILFAVLTVVAGVSIAVTGRYPRGIFDLNVGVLRWSMRVHFYAFTLATDRYPPFTLAEDPSYPVHLDVAYPARLSRGLVWVKWWLLAIPHYLVIAVFSGGFPHLAGGLIGLLCLIAGVTVAVRRAYPVALFDLVMGLHRWVWRVVAYAVLMRDEYPPFRLDMGPSEPGASHAAPLPPPAPPVPQAPSAPPAPLAPPHPA